MPARAVSALNVPAPGFNTTLQRRWLLTLGMVVVLLQSSVFAIIDPDLSGWHPHHGHISVGGFVPDHTHPWDHNHREATGFGDPVEIGFTGAGDVGSVAGMMIPAAALLALALLVAAGVDRLRHTRTPRTHTPAVLLPPPRS